MSTDHTTRISDDELRGPILDGVMRYEPFYAIGAFLKDPALVQLRNQGLGVDSSRAQELNQHIRSYRKHRRRATRDYYRGWEDEWDKPRWNRLYQPLHFWVFGYIDELILMLVDTPDFYFRLFGESTTTVSQVCLSSVPQLDSLGITPRALPSSIDGADIVPAAPFLGEGWNFGDYLADRWNIECPEDDQLAKLNPFVNVGSLFDPKINGDIHSEADSDRITPTAHPLKAATPLVLFSRIRLSSACNLGGTMMRRAVYRLISRIVVATQLRLLNALKDERESKRMEKLQIDEAAISNLTVSFFDNLGPEEIGILIGCRNYSVGFSVHNAIQAMTFRDLTDIEKHMAEDIQRSKIHSSLRKLSELPEAAHLQPMQEDTSNILQDNHLISLTHTNVGMASDSIEAISIPQPNASPTSTSKKLRQSKEKIRNCMSGIAEIYVRSTVSAGHNSSVDRCLQSASKHLANDRKQEFKWSKKYLRVLVGRYDLEFDGSWRLGKQRISPIPIGTIFTGMNEVLAELTCPKDGEQETGISEISTSLVVPIPQFECKENDRFSFPMPCKNSPNHVALVQAMKNIRERIFLQTKDSVLSVDRQSEAARYLRLPIRLRRLVRSIGNVFQNAISDPLLFDHVLDLYECIIALDHAITKDLPRLTDQTLEHICMEGGRESCDREEFQLSPEHIRKVEEALDGGLGQELVTSLGEYAQALADALDRRIFVETQHEFSEFAVDIRGGLVQLVHSAGVALKCGAGLLRFAYETDFGTFKNRLPTCKRIGLINRLTVHEVCETRCIKLDPASDASLAVMTFGVGHLINPLEFEIYIKETARMLLAAWDEQDGFIWPPTRPGPGSTDPRNLALSDIYISNGKEDVNDTMYFREEMFSVALTQVLVYGDDYALGQRESVAVFDAKYESGNMNRIRSHRSFAAYMLTSFMVVQGLTQYDRENKSKHGEDAWFDKGLPKAEFCDFKSASFRKVWKDFLDYCELHTEFFHRHRGFLIWLRFVVSRVETISSLEESLSDDGYGESARLLVRQFLLQIDALHDVLWRVHKLTSSYKEFYWKSLKPDDFKVLERCVGIALESGVGSVHSVMKSFNQYLEKTHADADGKLPDAFKYRGYAGKNLDLPDDHLDEFLILCLVIKSLAKRRVESPESVRDGDSGHDLTISHLFHMPGKSLSPLNSLYEHRNDDQRQKSNVLDVVIKQWGEELDRRQAASADRIKAGCDVVHDRRYNRFLESSPRREHRCCNRKSLP